MLPYHRTCSCVHSPLRLAVADLASQVEDLAAGEADITELAEGDDDSAVVAGGTMEEKCAFMVGVAQRLTRYAQMLRMHACVAEERGYLCMHPTPALHAAPHGAAC